MKKNKLKRIHLNLPFLAKRFLAINNINAGVLARELICDYFIERKSIKENCWIGEPVKMTYKNKVLIFEDWTFEEGFFTNKTFENVLLSSPNRKPGKYKRDSILTVSMYERIIVYFKASDLDLNDFIRTLVLTHIEKEFGISLLCWSQKKEQPKKEHQYKGKTFLINFDLL